MFTDNQKKILEWAKSLKSHKRTRKIVVNWDWTDGGKKTAYIYQEFVDSGMPRTQRTRLFTASPDKFDTKYKAAQEFVN